MRRGSSRRKKREHPGANRVEGSVRSRGTVAGPMFRSPAVRLLVVLGLFAIPQPAARAQAGMRVVAIERVRVDGALGDWRGANFTSVGDGSDASMRFALGYDERGLYLAAEVRDERMVRTARPGAREDAIILTLTQPGNRAAVDLYFFAGVPGRSAASAGEAPVGTTRVRPLRGAQVVEGPLSRGQGYVLEAFVPVSALPGRARWREARGSIRLRDVDREARPEVEAEPALVAVDPRRLETLVPLMISGGEGGVLEEFLAARNILAARPTHRLQGDVAGDARPESVTLVAGYLLVNGPGYRGGQGYAYHQLPVQSAGDVRSAELVDLTGDGKDELVLVLRQRNAQGERDLWQAMSLTGESPRPLFAIEVRKAIGASSVEAQVRIRRQRPAPIIQVRAGRARGLDASSYREAPASDAEAILVPWGPVLERTYRWNGRSFERTGERANPRYAPPRAATQSAPARAAEPAPPRAPGLDDLIAAFKRQRGIAASARPSHRLRANFAGGAEPETALVFGRQLVVVGPGIQNGTSWLYYEIPVSRDADLLGVEAADVTGDRRAELLLRVRQSFGDVHREILLVHQLTGRGFPRLLQVEVARTQGDSAIRNEVRTRGGHLEIAPGRARGWSEASYRFARDPNDSVEPLLLPWRDRPVRYTARGGRLVGR